MARDVGRAGRDGAQWERAHELVLELVAAADLEDGPGRDTPRASGDAMDLLRRLQAEPVALGRGDAGLPCDAFSCGH